MDRMKKEQSCHGVLVSRTDMDTWQEEEGLR
jgi:hypothetical protein